MNAVQSLKNLNNTELHEQMKTLAARERKLTREILVHIAEVDRRKLYLEKAHSSLFEYLTLAIGYSEGSAQRRIDAARLLQKLPEISDRVADGSLNLAQISKVQKICRQIKKDSGARSNVSAVSNAKLTDVMGKLVNRASRETDQILAQEFQVKIKSQTKQEIQGDGSVRVELTFSQEEFDLIKQAQSLLSNKTGGGLQEAIIEMAKRTVDASEPKASTATMAANNSSRGERTLRSVTTRLKKEIRSRDRCCQYKDAKTGKFCGSKYFLHIDHIQPKFAGGANAPANLRVLCKNHNLFRYQAEGRAARRES